MCVCQSGEAQDSHSEEDDEDAEAALKKEVSQIQTSMKSRQQRFTALDSGATNVVFIRSHGVGEQKPCVVFIIIIITSAD